jgi:AraC-like DNA-binding protein
MHPRIRGTQPCNNIIRDIIFNISGLKILGPYKSMRQGDSYIRATALIGFVEDVERTGGDPYLLIKEAEFENSALTNVDGLISYRKLALLLEIAAQRLDRPSFGVEWALNTPGHFPNLGPLALLAKYVGSLDEWIEMALKYWRFHTNAFIMSRGIDDKLDLATLRYSADSFALPGRQISELVLANICMLTRHVVGDDTITPTVVRFQHRQPKNLDAHNSAFRCALEFDADHTELLFDKKFLTYPTNGNLKFFKSIVGTYIKSRIDRMPAYDSTMATMVALAIPSVIGTGRCGVDFIASTLELHPKQLQRLLAEEGTNFSEILETVRQNMARRLLSESDASIERIAGLLDYASTPPFTAAFKRWTGQSPLNFRKAEQTKIKS